MVRGGHPSAAGRDGMNDLLIPVAGLLPLMGAPAQSANRAHLRQRSPTSLRRQHRLALVPRTSTISRASVSVSHPSSSWRRSDYFDAISICKDQRRALLPVRSLSRFINYWKSGQNLAERVGFEPTVEFLLHTLSKRAPSTTRTSLRIFRISSLQASG